MLVQATKASLSTPVRLLVLVWVRMLVAVEGVQFEQPLLMVLVAAEEAPQCSSVGLAGVCL